MNFVPHTELEKKEMLKAIGLKGIDELFKDIPVSLRPKSFNISIALCAKKNKRNLDNCRGILAG